MFFKHHEQQKQRKNGCLPKFYSLHSCVQAYFLLMHFFHAIYECIVNKCTLCALDHAYRRIHFHSVKQTAAVSFSPIPSRSDIFCKHFVTKYCVNGFYHIGTMPCMQVLHFMQLIIEYIPSAG